MTTIPPVGTGYLSGGSNYVDFLQWNDQGGHVSGSAQVDYVSGQVPNLSTQSNTLTLVGTLSGSTLSISFNAGPSQFGTISGGSFTLDVPQQDGTLAPITFHSASATDYNAAVASLSERVQAANAQEASAEAIAAEQKKIDAAATQVWSDIGGLPSQGLSDETKQQFASDLAQAASDDANTQNEEQTVAGEVGQDNNGQTCIDANQVAIDANQVAIDANQVETTASSVAARITTDESNIKSLQSDFADYQAEAANLPTYQSSNPPTQPAVDQAIATANAAIASARSDSNNEIAQGNAQVVTAYQYAAQAYQAGGCGQAPAAPNPQPDI